MSCSMGSLAVFRPPEGGVNGRKMNLSRLVLSKIVLDLGGHKGEKVAKTPGEHGEKMQNNYINTGISRCNFLLGSIYIW